MAAVPKDPALVAKEAQDGLVKVKTEIFEYLNKLRQNPKMAIPTLQKQLPLFKEKLYLAPPDTVGLKTKEGAAAVQECITFLEKQAAVPVFTQQDGLQKAAQDLVNDGQNKGTLGHISSDKATMSDRVKKQGGWEGRLTENISYGRKTAEDIVLDMLVDDGLPSRAHRTNIFNPELLQVGIAFGPHKTYEHVCVIDFATNFSEARKDKMNPTVEFY